MAWFDPLYSPDMLGVLGLAPSTAPGSYGWFRGLYPPNAPGTNGMAPVPGMPEIRAPGKAPPVYPPMPPMPGAAPGPIPAYPQAPKAADEWNPPPGVAQYYADYTRVKGEPERSKPDKPARVPVPASDPPAMFGVTPDTLPLINAVPYSNTGTASAPASPKQPSWYDRNKEWITMASRDLGALGRGMLQAPPGYNAFGQGFANVVDDREKRIDTDLKRQLLKAQVGKAESESTARQALRDFAIQQKLPTGVALSLMLNPDKAAEILEKYDPAMKEAFLKFTEEKSGATAKGSFPYDLAKSAAQATKVSVSMPAEFQAKLDSLAKYRAAAADPKLSPAQRADAQKMADGIERSITQKDTPDAKYMEQIAGMERGVQGAERLRELVKKYGVSSLDPAGRAAIAQEYSWLITAMKQTEGFGAALTGNEQAILEAGLRNPNNFVNNALIGSKTHLALIDKYIEFTRQRAQSYDRLRRTGTLPPGLSEPPPPPSGFNRMGR